MIPYKQLYAFLCAKQSDAIDLLQSGRVKDAEALLKESLLEAEERYLAAEEIPPSSHGNVLPQT